MTLFPLSPGQRACVRDLGRLEVVEPQAADASDAHVELVFSQVDEVLTVQKHAKNMEDFLKKCLPVQLFGTSARKTAGHG